MLLKLLRGQDPIRVATHAVIVVFVLYTMTVLWNVVRPLSHNHESEPVALSAEERSSIQLHVQNLQADIPKLETSIRRLIKLQELQYHNLVIALDKIEERHRLHPDIFEAIGPASSLNLLEHPKASWSLSLLMDIEVYARQAVDVSAISAFEADQALNRAIALRANFDQLQEYRQLFYDRRYSLEEQRAIDEAQLALSDAELELKILSQPPEYRVIEEPIPEEERYLYEPPPSAWNLYQSPPVYEPPRTRQRIIEIRPKLPPRPPNPYLRRRNISDRQASLLYIGHKLIADISAVQASINQLTFEIVEKQRTILQLKQALKTNVRPSSL